MSFPQKRIPLQLGFCSVKIVISLTLEGRSIQKLAADPLQWQSREFTHAFRWASRAVLIVHLRVSPDAPPSSPLVSVQSCSTRHEFPPAPCELELD